jgi:ankyrin repeat protein
MPTWTTGKNALIHASWEGHVGVAKTLFANGADVDASVQAISQVEHKAMAKDKAD